MGITHDHFSSAFSLRLDSEEYDKLIHQIPHGYTETLLNSSISAWTVVQEKWKINDSHLVN